MRPIAAITTVLAVLVLCPQAAALPRWQWPVEGPVITPYRNGPDPYAGGQHRGIDIAAPIGTAVGAAAAGTVTYAGVAGSSGLTVAVSTDDGFDTSYLHLSAIRVRTGDRVSAGQELGAVGTSGRRSAAEPHLHFGVRDAGTRFAYHDPLDFLPPLAAPSPEPRAEPVPVGQPLTPRSDPVAARLAAVPVFAPLGAAVGLGSRTAPVAPLRAALAPKAAPAAGAGVPTSGLAVHASSRNAGAAATRRAPAGEPTAPRAVARTAIRTSRSLTSAPGTRRPEGRQDRTRARAEAPSPALGPAAAHPPAAGARIPSARVRAHARPARPRPPSGLDVGWLAACAGLVAAATVLGRSATRPPRGRGQRPRPAPNAPACGPHSRAHTASNRRASAAASGSARVA